MGAMRLEAETINKTIDRYTAQENFGQTCPCETNCLGLELQVHRFKTAIVLVTDSAQAWRPIS